MADHPHILVAMSDRDLPSLIGANLLVRTHGAVTVTLTTDLAEAARIARDTPITHAVVHGVEPTVVGVPVHLAATIRETRPSTRVVVMSGHSDEARERMRILWGADVHLDRRVERIPKAAGVTEAVTRLTIEVVPSDTVLVAALARTVNGPVAELRAEHVNAALAPGTRLVSAEPRNHAPNVFEARAARRAGRWVLQHGSTVCQLCAAGAAVSSAASPPCEAWRPVAAAAGVATHKQCTGTAAIRDGPPRRAASLRPLRVVLPLQDRLGGDDRAH